MEFDYLADLRDIRHRRDIENLELAKFFAEQRSKDPSTKSGAVIVRPDNTVASMGYNGFPSGMTDSHDRLHIREEKYERVVHCEMNAVITAREPLHGYTLYTWPFLTCHRCAVHMIQAGIKRVVAPKCPTDQVERWEKHFVRTREFYRECGVEFEEIEMYEDTI